MSAPVVEDARVMERLIAKMRGVYAEECRALLEEMAQRASCNCGLGAGLEDHDIACPVAVWLRAAHTVWMWGQP